MIYDTGDIHGNQFKFVEQIEPALSPGDILIVNGDFGIGFFKGRFWSEEQFYDFISEQDYTVCFVDGNHENFVKLASYPVEKWNGGKVQKIRHNLIHLLRGEVYRIDGVSIFAFGGGYSFDKAYRTENETWWPQEMPSEEEYRNADRNLKKVGYQVDYIITHTAPSETIRNLSTRRDVNLMKSTSEELALNTFLDYIQDRVSYKHWYFGHFHLDIENIWRNQTVLLSTVRELESGRVVRQWRAYEG